MPKSLDELADDGLIDPGWARALAPVAPRIAELGDFLRAETAAGRGYLPIGDRVLRAFAAPLVDVRVLIVERGAERAQHVLAAREVAVAGRRLGAEEVAHVGDARPDRGEGACPARVDEPVGGELVEGLPGHRQLPIVETSTPPSVGRTRQTLPLPSTRRPPSPTMSAVRSSMPSPPATSPDSTAATRRESMPRSAPGSGPTW